MIFDYVSTGIPELETLTNKGIIAIANIFDADYPDIEWEYIGHAPVKVKGMRLPNKLNGENVNRFDGKLIRPATEEELELVRLESDKAREPYLSYITEYTSGSLMAFTKLYFENRQFEHYYDHTFTGSKWDAAANKEGILLEEDTYTNDSNNLLDDEATEEQYYQIPIEFKLESDGFGTSENLDTRYFIEDLLDRRLQNENAGFCDGGEIGEGKMFIFCYSQSPERAVEIINDELRKHDFLR
ncbi:hypothetical protein [Desulforamulus aquiferis]|uniref:hypothetical protein n=1 Tax=Desulforamulus aquiferis TaxID=1397668 RepID=UPI002714A068|nr:hypothetical protein [Desulforamulus aquiferis]